MERWKGGSFDSYDLDGNLTSTTDGNGVKVNYGYDADKRQTTQTVPGGTTILITNPYDAFGDATQTQDAAGGTSSSQYYGFGRVVQSINPAGLTMNYTCNAADQITKVSYPNDTLHKCFDEL